MKMTTLKPEHQYPRKRNYRVKFRFNIKLDKETNRSKFLQYYMPRWAKFMSTVMRIKLAPHEIRDTALLRKIVPEDIKVSDIVEELMERDADLTRLLLEAAPVFDLSPHDLKLRVIAAFGISSNEFKIIST